MPPPVEISIPSTTLSSPSSSKPFTLYNITLRLPLRTFIVQKRYSEFAAIDADLRAHTNTPPPSPLPSKSWLPFKSTITDPALTESRRLALETYLRAIAESADARWRSTSIWRTFLNLPSSTAAANSSRADAHAAVTGGGQAALFDPAAWLDVHREMKGQLHDARLHLGRRDVATSAQAQHEAGACAKRCLVKAANLIGCLEDGLANKEGAGRVGEGEARRRGDLLASARTEREGLEKLAVSLAVKGNAAGGSASGSGSATPTNQEKQQLFGGGVGQRPSGRVLGGPVPELARTRELDNDGIFNLQKQMMQEQDSDVEELSKIVRRQKEMGLAIYDELELQNEMLTRVDEDVDRVKGKIDVAKKRVGKLR